MKWFSSLFWYSLVLFLVNQFIELQGVFIPFIHSYLDDFLCPPIVLGFTLFVQQQLTYRNPNYRLGAMMILFFAIWYSFIFEVLLPLASTKYHSDFFDVLAYLLGSFIFFKFGNKPVLTLISPSPNTVKSR